MHTKQVNCNRRFGRSLQNRSACRFRLKISSRKIHPKNKCTDYFLARLGERMEANQNLELIQFPQIPGTVQIVPLREENIPFITNDALKICQKRRMGTSTVLSAMEWRQPSQLPTTSSGDICMPAYKLHKHQRVSSGLSHLIKRVV